MIQPATNTESAGPSQTAASAAQQDERMARNDADLVQIGQQRGDEQHHRQEQQRKRATALA